MLTWALLTAVVSAATSLLVEFWDAIKDFLLETAERIKRTLFWRGVKVFIQKMGRILKEIAKHYSQKENGTWVETTTTREVSASEVPPEILAQARERKEVDITQQMQLALS